MRVYTNKNVNGLKEYNLCVTDNFAFMNDVVLSNYQKVERSFSGDTVTSSQGY